jgi:hypothetical protein
LEALQQGDLTRSQESLVDPSASPTTSSSNKKKRASPAAGDATTQPVVIDSPAAAGTEEMEVKSVYTPESGSAGGVGDIEEKHTAGSPSAEPGVEGAAGTADATDKCCILHMDSLGMHGTASIGKWLKR